MPNQNNFIRPSSTYSASSTMKLDSTEISRKKTSVVILTLLSIIIFLFILSLLLICALVVVGNGISAKKDTQVVKSSDISSISLTNRAINQDKNTIDTSDPKYKKNFDMSLGKMASKLVENLTFRLPAAIRPTSYNLFLHPNLETKTFQGNVKIDFNVSESVSFVALHSKYLNITTNKLIKNLENGAEGIPIKSSFEYEKFEYFIVEPETKLEAGNYTIDLDFDGSLDHKIVGFYGSSYLDSTKNQTRYIATSKFEPTFARQSFPCFDEPSMKAKFKISLISPSGDGYSALSNMDQEGEPEDFGNNLVKVNFRESVPMSTYLTVFIVSDFDSVQQTITPSVGEPFLLRCFSTPVQVSKLEFALNTSVAVIQYYINYFKIAYPLPKLDLAAIPDFVSGAMETWGLVTYRETNLLYDREVSSTANKQKIAGVIGHEFAHMWFGNLVTMKWWSDLWLNEGFASYIEFKGVAAAWPEWKMEDQFTVDTMHSIMNLDATLGSHPIVIGVETPNQITEIFDGITYNKGASIIRMVEDFIGLENFQNGVSEYLEENKFKNADSNDLVKHLENKNDEDVTTIINTWIRQKGLPVVTVTREGNNFRLTQKRFLTDPDNEGKETVESDYKYKWSIPITYVTSANTTDVLRAWFHHNVESILINVEESIEWIKFNKNQVGYYRVNYDSEMWMSLNKALEDDVDSMTALDRAHLLNDVFSLAEGLQVPYDTALTMTQYLKNETHFVPWDVASSKLKSIRNLLYYTEFYTQFKDYAVNLVDTAYKATTWEVNPDEHFNNLFRNTILDLACSMDHPECMKKVGVDFLEWINSDNAETVRPPPDLRSLIYYHGMRSVGGENEWNKMFALFEKEQDASEKTKLQSALAAVKEPWILRKLIDLASDSEKYVRKQDYFTMMGSISGNRIGEGLVWDYVRDNWSAISDRFGLSERNLGRLIPTITGRFTTKSKLNEMKRFFEDYPNAGAGANARIQAVEAVENNIKWLERNQKSIGDWLSSSL